MKPTQPSLADTGFTPESSDPISTERVELLAACVDADPDRLVARALPPLWHWACFAPRVPTSTLGPDGHPRRRPEMDAFPQRMWVGGRVTIADPLALDVPATRISQIQTAVMKEGGAGAFWLVTVAHAISQRGEIRITEEQDLVFRPAVALTSPGPDRDDPPAGNIGSEWVERLTPDPVLLFRFSAVTNNAHRIHYDHPYAVGVEGYPDLVVHGPLTAVLLSEFARRRSGLDAREISYRARVPHFANRPLWLTGQLGDNGATQTAAIRADHEVAMTLEAR